MITSKNNQFLKLYGELQKKKYRREYGLFPAEGKRLIEELTDSGLCPHLILYCDNFADIAYLEKICPRADNCFAVDKKIFAGLTDTQNSQGIVGAFPLLCPELASFQSSPGDLVLVLNAIQDPGNLGAIIRSGAAAGAAGIILEEGTVDLYNPKVVRSTMGAIATIPIFYDLTFKEIRDYLKGENFNVYLSHMEGANPYWEIPIDRRTAIVFGNEGAGLSNQWQNAGFENIFIPQTDKIESLNVAMAAGIIAFDFRRRCLK